MLLISNLLSNRLLVQTPFLFFEYLMVLTYLLEGCILCGFQKKVQEILIVIVLRSIAV
jgi:CHASE2 domain-containing sensor protein